MKVHVIDHYFLGVEHTIASFLVEGASGLVLIETGPTTTLPNVLDGIRAIGFDPSDIKHVLLTHIHFDHAGAAGWWAEQGAHIYVHQRGARHLIDPSRLWNSAARLYGDQMEVLWGSMTPIASENLTALEDNDVVTVDDLTFTAWDTPGHARHHHVFAINGVGFVGDVAGGRLPNSKFITLTAPPPEFDPVGFESSLSRVQDAKFDRLYLTHYGAVNDVDDHIDRYKEIVWGSAELVRAHMRNGLGRDAINERYLAYVTDRAIQDGLSEAKRKQYETVVPQEMSTDGIMLYWNRLAKKAAEAKAKGEQS